MTDWARVPPKLSPTLLSFALTVCPMRTTIGVPEGTVIGLGVGGGAGVIAMAGAGGGAGAAGGGAAGAGAGAAGSAAAGAGAAGAGAAGGVDWAVSPAGAGPLLHPPRSSKPAKDKVLSRTWAAGLRAGPRLVWAALEKACLIIVLSLNAIFMLCGARPSCPVPATFGFGDPRSVSLDR